MLKQSLLTKRVTLRDLVTFIAQMVNVDLFRKSTLAEKGKPTHELFQRVIY